ncbi:hypothetical protein EZV62_018033 [Acer yangbiense]|uniref:Uncharacterized protein n=1 Tax=Acer yangbiense TaxID=1000413 RepID=A0A5C7HI62_9ROSI|nr:hypothetical protein EZV62_018033 [Acer yangbiense]
MASDASSGPSHRELTWESSAQSIDRHGASTYSSKEKLHKQRMKRDERRIKVETDKPELKAKGADPAQTGSKDDWKNARRVLGVHAIIPCLRLYDRIGNLTRFKSCSVPVNLVIYIRFFRIQEGSQLLKIMDTWSGEDWFVGEAVC